MSRDPMIEFYGGVFRHVWNGERVPTPQALADWIESRTWRVDREWLALMIERLRNWPEGRNYPLVPDDEALENGMADEPRWWEPGALRGDLVRTIEIERN